MKKLILLFTTSILLAHDEPEVSKPKVETPEEIKLDRDYQKKLVDWYKQRMAELESKISHLYGVISADEGLIQTDQKMPAPTDK